MRFLTLFLIAVTLTGCSTSTPIPRVENAQKLLQNQHWKSARIQTETFELWSATKSDKKTKTLTVYIEGDGHAWESPKQPSDDPTPIQPVGLELALQDPSSDVAYLARPCQYVGAETPRNCSKAYWTYKRFAPEVITSLNEAITQLKQRQHAQELILVGFSGGGAVAALIAAQRKDVVKLITVAGNLDITAWVTYHRLTPLTGSLNPADFVTQLQPIAQLHFAGRQDQVIPVSITESFIKRFPAQQRPKLVVIEKFTHVCCWAENWARLLNQSP